jgi:hypothetical protein
MGEQYTGSTRIFSVERMMELLEQDVPLESVDKDGKTFLRHACADGKSDIAKFLLDSGADVNSRDKEGKTPLMAAAMIGRLEIVKLLLEQGADPRIESQNGDSAAKMAQRWGKKEIVQVLLEQMDQSSVLHNAARPASDATNVQAIQTPWEHPIPEKPEEALVPEIAAPKPLVVEAEVVQTVVRQVVGSESPSPRETSRSIHKQFDISDQHLIQSIFPAENDW